MLTDLPQSVIKMLNIVRSVENTKYNPIFLLKVNFLKSFFKCYGEFCTVIHDHTKLSLRRNKMQEAWIFCLIVISSLFTTTLYSSPISILASIKSRYVYDDHSSVLKLNSLV